MTESHAKFRTREYWEKQYATAREVMRKVFILNESKPLAPMEIMNIRDIAASKLGEAFPDLDVTITPSWIKPMVTEDSVFVGLEFADPGLFFDAVMDVYNDDPVQLKAGAANDYE